jgi:hypothetical protein
MPEYHQIETYTRIEQDISNHIAVCKDFLYELGLWNTEIENWLNGFVSYDSDDSFGHSVLSPKMKIAIGDQPIDVQVMLSLWTINTIKNLENDLLRFDVIFETQNIDDESRNPEIRYTEDAQKIVWNLMEKASKFFPEYGVFFTDEAQDGVSMESILSNVSKKLWQFECAIISNNIKERFALPNDDFFFKETENHLWLARKFVWDNPIWEN